MRQRKPIEVMLKGQTQFGDYQFFCDAGTGPRYNRLVKLSCAAGHIKICEVYDLFKPQRAHLCRECKPLSPRESTDGPKKKRGKRSGRYPIKTFASEYMCWRNIRRRCRDPKHKQYADYGRRGIGVADEWHDSFDCFMDSVGAKPHQGLSLDRIDNDKGYIPGNVRWATQRLQNNNKRPPQRTIAQDDPIGYLNTEAIVFCF